MTLEQMELEYQEAKKAVLADRTDENFKTWVTLCERKQLNELFNNVSQP
jgi:hypothetical protein